MLSRSGTSLTARTEPPAITPVPGAAGFIITFAAPKFCKIGCGMVALFERYPDQRLLGGRPRPYGIASGHLVRLAQAHADDAVAIADDDQRAEAEAPPALHHLGHAINFLTTRSSRFRPVGSILGIRVSCVALADGPTGPKVRRPPSRAPSARAFTPTVVEKAATVEHDRRDALLLRARRQLSLAHALRPIALLRDGSRRGADLASTSEAAATGLAGHVVDDLPVDMCEAAEHRCEPGSLGGAAEACAEADDAASGAARANLVA